MLDDQYGGSRFQGGKPFCASFCGSLIAGSRRAFLCVDWPCRLCLFLKWTRCERLLLVKVCKAFLFVFFLLFLLFFRHLKITLDSEQPMLKKERIIPSVWGGINVLNSFKEASIFLIIVHSSCESIFFSFVFFLNANFPFHSLWNRERQRQWLQTIVSLPVDNCWSWTWLKRAKQTLMCSFQYFLMIWWV